MNGAATAPLLEAVGLSKNFSIGGRLSPGGRKTVRAVDNVSLQVWPGETVGLVGESGCGKSTLGRCLVRLYDVTSGQLRFKGEDISQYGRRQLRPIREEMQMVFQDPYASLNPRRRVGDLIAEPLRVHGRRSRAEIAARVRELMGLVGLSTDQLERFPHEFSGGQRQRIGIARALALRPKVLVLDEPVSALDVSIRAGILNLLQDAQAARDLSYVFVSHDLSVVRHIATRVAVMYLGKIVEVAPVEQLFTAAAHPYTQALISAIPVPDPRKERSRRRVVVTGDVPSAVNPPTGCRFRTRCPKFATLSEDKAERCINEEPARLQQEVDHVAACHYAAAEEVV